MYTYSGDPAWEGSMGEDEVAGVTDKRQITAVFGGGLSVDFAHLSVKDS